MSTISTRFRNYGYRGPCLAVAVTALIVIATAAARNPAGAASGQERLRARALGIHPGSLAPGTHNAITDVEGVLVGHTTVFEGSDLRTGVTAIVPHPGNLFREKVPAAIVVGNGFGKLAGYTQVQELGTLETPILLTGTLSVPRVADALITYMLGLPGNENVRSINPVVGETNDGGLSDIRARPIRPEHVFDALTAARGGAVPEGALGAGTGTRAFGFKGGIGTSSRRVGDTPWTIGVLVQSNFGAPRGLRIVGVNIGAELAPTPSPPAPTGVQTDEAPAREASVHDAPAPGDGSCMIVLATDAPLDHRGLERVALRALMGMARTGSNFSNGSGDYVVAFSTHPAFRSGPEAPAATPVRALDGASLSPLFQGAIEATEEAIYNSLFAAQRVVGFEGRVAEALPVDQVIAILRRHGVLR